MNKEEILDLARSQLKSLHFNKNFFLIAFLIGIVLLFIGILFFNSNRVEQNNVPQVVTKDLPKVVPKSAYVPGQLIIKFKKDVPEAVLREHFKAYSATIKSRIEKINTIVLEVPKGDEENIKQQLAQDPLVEYVNFDYVLTPYFIPDDPLWINQWGLKNVSQIIKKKTGLSGADIHVEGAWDVTRGAGIRIAVLDSGIDVNHPEFASKVISQKAFITSTIDDEYSHGTKTAGIAAANTNNALGIAGVCPDCKLLIGKVLDYSVVGSASTLASGIIWATDNGEKVISISSGISTGTTEVNSGVKILQDAVDYAWGKGVVIVAAAGNTGANYKTYPAALSNVIAVAATDNNDKRASFSSYGEWVDIAAPGENIFSTVPTHPTTFTTATNYDYDSGTSMATPMVSAVAALVWSTPYGTSNQAVVDRILSTADTINCTRIYWQNGRLNAAAAVESESATFSASITPKFVNLGTLHGNCPVETVKPIEVPSITYQIGPGCGGPNDKGNEKGIGKYCTKGGNQCATTGAGELYCSVDILDNVPGICSNRCTSDTDCGSNAKCIAVPGVPIKFCEPLTCKRIGSAATPSATVVPTQKPRSPEAVKVRSPKEIVSISVSVPSNHEGFFERIINFINRIFTSLARILGL